MAWLRDTQAFRVTLPPSISVRTSDEVPIFAPPGLLEATPRAEADEATRSTVTIYRFRDEVARAHFGRQERPVLLIRP